MPTLSFDGQSFLIDSRRIWLVSGAIHYARTPHQLWRSRIRAAKQAGLNCIETYCFWNLHEPRPGVFNFEGDADLRQFVQTVGQEGMYCIVRPGPYICAEWDFGGLPAWLHNLEELRAPWGLKLREGNPAFLAACARYLGAIMDQIRDLQVNAESARAAGSENGKATGASGPLAAPVIMVQAENEWISHNPEQADRYLREIVRYLRENGCTTPINVCNNLWQRVDGAIDTWNANQHLAPDLRQLAVVQPDAPRMVTEFWPGWFDQWGKPHHREYDGQWNLYRLAQILSAGAQYNLYMFHGGTNFGFFGGRTIAGPDCFMTTSYDYDAPLREAGGRGEKYLAIKRISTFASQFGQLFAHLIPTDAHAAIAPDDGAHDHSIVEQAGSQGRVVFVLRGAHDKATQVKVLLHNGLELPVPLGRDRAAWFVLNANLGGVAELTYTNLRPWAFVDRRMLVLFGPAGAQGLISINDAAWSVTVPKGRQPLVEVHESITVVVLNEEQVDAAYLAPQGLIVGAAGLNERNAPLPLPDWPQAITISTDGKTSAQRLAPTRPPAPPRLERWQRYIPRDLIDGSSDAFKPIDGPASHEQLGNDFGYGWYRLGIKSARAGEALAPQSGDRLHLFARGRRTALLGLGAGATYDPARLRLDTTQVVMADNLGRFNFGWQVGERKGLFGDLQEVRPIKLGKPKIIESQTPDPFQLRGFVLYTRRHEHQPAHALAWSFKAKPDRPVVLDIQGLPAKAMILLNHKPIDLYDRHFSAGVLRILINRERGLRKGANELRLALFAPHDPAVDVTRFVRLYECVTALTHDAQWAFAPWSVPGAEQFEPARVGRATGVPTWFRAAFRLKDSATPLWLDAAGLTKGQFYLNGHNLGRYFVATASGRLVPPQSRYYLPEPWLRTDDDNELIIFDEHGAAPGKCRLAYDPMGPYGA